MERCRFVCVFFLSFIRWNKKKVLVFFRPLFLICVPSFFLLSTKKNNSSRTITLQSFDDRPKYKRAKCRPYTRIHRPLVSSHLCHTMSASLFRSFTLPFSSFFPVLLPSLCSFHTHGRIVFITCIYFTYTPIDSRVYAALSIYKEA